MKSYIVALIILVVVIGGGWFVYSSQQTAYVAPLPVVSDTASSTPLQNYTLADVAMLATFKVGVLK